MGFRREVHHHVEALLGEELIKETFIPYISMDEPMPFRQARRKVLKIGKVARVGQGIQVYQPPVWPRRQDVADEVCSNETGTSGNQYGLYAHNLTCSGFLLEYVLLVSVHPETSQQLSNFHSPLNDVAR